VPGRVGQNRLVIGIAVDDLDELVERLALPAIVDEQRNKASA
jgi:hypothetical protein